MGYAITAVGCFAFGVFAVGAIIWIMSQLP